MIEANKKALTYDGISILKKLLYSLPFLRKEVCAKRGKGKQGNGHMSIYYFDPYRFRMHKMKGACSKIIRIDHNFR